MMLFGNSWSHSMGVNARRISPLVTQMVSAERAADANGMCIPSRHINRAPAGGELRIHKRQDGSSPGSQDGGAKSWSPCGVRPGHAT